ncbi:DUF1465 family protein [Camelimonas abortus]|uniref:DUF1465 family protein n=1 Tax=Camelimonas abortus TaxID=1017184 RepID=A0ABV7LE35_9HYPH
MSAEVTPVPFGARYATTQAFVELFAEANRLVEETADYLDGEGRRDAAMLGAEAACAYARESMRLTTRLMRLMSWLILRRAVADGDMTPEEADAERRKSMAHVEPTPTLETVAILPERLGELIAAAARLELRVLHIDASEVLDAPRPSPVRRELSLLRAAFSARPPLPAARREPRGLVAPPAVNGNGQPPADMLAGA